MHYCGAGQTKVYGATLLRLRREDFGEIRHQDGISPAWPLAYEDCESVLRRSRVAPRREFRVIHAAPWRRVGNPVPKAS